MKKTKGMYALVVDDDETSIILVENILLQKGYEVRIAHNGREAIEILKDHPAHLIITDWEMPELSGIELCQAVRKSDLPGYVYIIMITGRNGEEQKLAGLMAGADNFITKPVKPAELLVCLKTAERILSLETCELAIFALARLAESRDLETGAHLERVQKYARILAEELSTMERYKGVIDSEYRRLLFQTSPLHDIGKVGIPDIILLKPGRLDEREMTIMRTHTDIGASTLDDALHRFPNAKYLGMAREIAATHHEKFDGSGYPRGLVGNAIPLCGRIVALADVYDALTSRRIYKTAMTHEKAREIILRESGSHFDPDIVAAFMNRESEFFEIKRAFADPELPSTPRLVATLANLSATNDNKLPSILLVEDDPAQLEGIASMLLDNGYSVLRASDVPTALTVFEQHRPRLIISDWAMPGPNGTDLCRALRSRDQAEYVFFLMLTMNTAKEHMIEAFDAGVDDFVVKPFHHGELLARIRAGLRTIRLHDELHRRNQGVQQLNAQLMQLNTRLESFAITDELTGLYNRRQGLARLQERVELADRYGEALSIAMLDVDHFKRINDTFGHNVGDEALRSVAATLLSNVRTTDTVCRIGGEEFLIIFPAQTAQEAFLSVERCRIAIASQAINTAEGKIIHLTLSAGITASLAGRTNAVTLLKDADIALYASKAAGRNCATVASASTTTEIRPEKMEYLAQ